MKIIHFFSFGLEPTNMLGLAIKWDTLPTAVSFRRKDFTEKASFSVRRRNLLGQLKNQFSFEELQQFLNAKVDQPNWYRQLL